MKAQQFVLDPSLKARFEHGGSIGKGKRKVARPIAVKRPMHLVLRATQAQGTLSFLKPQNSRLVESLVASLSRKYQVRVYELGNSGNHLHLLVKAKTRRGMQNFLRVLAGQIAQRLLRGRVLPGRFWDELVYSRIVEWGRAFMAAKAYVLLNRLEGLGLVPYSPRNKKLNRKASRSGIDVKRSRTC